VTKNVGYDRLVLSACNPLYSAAQRIIVFARLRTIEPAGAGKSVA
jgi:sortase A